MKRHPLRACHLVPLLARRCIEKSELTLGRRMSLAQEPTRLSEANHQPVVHTRVIQSKQMRPDTLKGVTSRTPWRCNRVRRLCMDNRMVLLWAATSLRHRRILRKHSLPPEVCPG